jgi:MFS family permease
MPKGYARYALLVMVGINFLNYLDRYVPVAAAPEIQKEFHLSDTALGLLGSAFLLVYAVSALPFGYWADRGVRRTVIGVGVTIWSLATLVTGFARNFAQLFLGRAIVGVGEASYYPAGTALLGDYFPKASRARAMSIWNAGTVVGIAVGFAGGGLVAARLGWRAAFFLTAVPGLLFAILAFRLREPLRGAAEARGPRLEAVGHASLGKFLQLLRIRTLRYTILSQTVLFFVLAGNAAWLPVALHRRFGMGTATGGVLSGGVLVTGGLIGTLAGGWLADRRNRVTPRGNLEVGVAGFLLGTVFITIGITAPSFALFVPSFLLAVACLYLYAGPFTAISQNVVVPSLRASAVTMTLFVAHLFGDSYSPFAIGLISDSVHDLQRALLIVSPTLLLVAAGLAALALKWVDHDQRLMETTWNSATSEGLTLTAD